MPPLTEARKRAKANYNKKVSKICVEFYPADAELFHWVKQQESIQKYIKSLIKDDIEVNKKDIN